MGTLKNILRPPGMAVCKIGKTVYKVPLTIKAFHELKEEQVCLEQAKQDKHFSHYIPDYSYFFLLRIPYFLSLDSRGDKHTIIGRYFEEAFVNASQWRRKDLRTLIYSEYLLKFISRYNAPHYKFWNDAISSIKLPVSSVHGDFYPDNIFFKDGTLVFIDWIRYQRESSRYFDLVDFFIFSEKPEGSSWFDFWKASVKNQPSELFHVPLPRHSFLSYSIWKVAEELKTLYKRSNLNRYKVKKYISMLQSIKIYVEPRV